MSRAKNEGPDESAPTVIEAEPEKPRDVVLVNGQTEHGVSILRLRDERIELGELRAVREGTPVYGELVKLSPRPDHPMLFDAETLVRGPEAPPRVDAPSVADEASPPRAVAPGAHKGPPRVTSEAFRSGWDGVFGAKARKPSLN